MDRPQIPSPCHTCESLVGLLVKEKQEKEQIQGELKKALEKLEILANQHQEEGHKKYQQEIHRKDEEIRQLKSKLENFNGSRQGPQPHSSISRVIKPQDDQIAEHSMVIGGQLHKQEQQRPHLQANPQIEPQKPNILPSPNQQEIKAIHQQPAISQMAAAAANQSNIQKAQKLTPAEQQKRRRERKKLAKIIEQANKTAQNKKEELHKKQGNAPIDKVKQHQTPAKKDEQLRRDPSTQQSASRRYRDSQNGRWVANVEKKSNVQKSERSQTPNATKAELKVVGSKRTVRQRGNQNSKQQPRRSTRNNRCQLVKVDGVMVEIPIEPYKERAQSPEQAEYKLHEIESFDSEESSENQLEIVQQHQHSTSNQLHNPDQASASGIRIQSSAGRRLKCPSITCQAMRGLIQSMKQHVRETKGADGHENVYCIKCDSVFFKAKDKEDHDKLDDCVRALVQRQKGFLSTRQKEIVHDFKLAAGQTKASTDKHEETKHKVEDSESDDSDSADYDQAKPMDKGSLLQALSSTSMAEASTFGMRDIHGSKQSVPKDEGIKV